MTIQGKSLHCLLNKHSMLNLGPYIISHFVNSIYIDPYEKTLIIELNLACLISF